MIKVHFVVRWSFDKAQDVLACLIHAIIDGEDDYSSLKDGDGNRGSRPRLMILGLSMENLGIEDHGLFFIDFFLQEGIYSLR